MMPLRDDVKLALRVSGDTFDAEIDGLIDAARRDLILAGIRPGVDDPRVRLAVILYCKALFGWDNPESDRFMASYDTIKRQLATITDYIGGDAS